MAVPSKAQLERGQQMMMDNFTEYRDSINDAMGEVEASLGRGEYAVACRQLSAISQQHAKTSVNFRNTLIRQGFLSKESEDD